MRIADMKTILLASNNQGKQRELLALLGDLGIEILTPSALGLALEVDETGTTYAENATLKAEAFGARSGLLTVADDSGLEVDALDGAPGVRSARFAGDEASDADNVALLLDRLVGLGAVTAAERRARFRCCIVVQSPPAADGSVIELVADGTVEGRIAEAPRGNGGFGYDPVFVPDGYDHTFAELGDEVKNEISHRARATAKLLEAIRDGAL